MKIDALLRHAKRFGTEGILGTAASMGFSLEEMTKLVEGLDKIEDDAARARRFDRPKKRRLSAETRAKRLLGITEGSEEA